MKLRPLYDRIVVKRIEEHERMQGGLYMPDSAKEKPQEGEVVAVGKGKRLEDGNVAPLDVRAGDRILFGKYSGSNIKINGNEYLVMREDEILGILSPAISPALALTGTYGAIATQTTKRPVGTPVRSSRGDDFEMLDLRKEIADIVPDWDQWLTTPNPQFNGRRPADLLDGPDEEDLRELLRAVKYVAIS